MTLSSGIEIPSEKIELICRKYHVRRMSVFGSAARGEMRPDSDIDIVVDLDPDARIGWEFFGLEEELSALLGRRVDLGTLDSLRPYARPSALRDSVVIYAAR